MRDIKKFLVCGGGMMGSAIAQILAGLEGVEVTVYDVFPVDIEAKVRANMDKLSDLSKPAKKSKILSVAPTGIDIEADVDDEE